MSFSVIIPFYNEEQNIKDLITEIIISLDIYDIYELILINDASSDNTAKVLNNIKKENNKDFKIITNNINIGQSFSIIKGVKLAKYDTIVTLDGDGQNNPIDIRKLIKIYNDNNLYLIGGIRNKRKDILIKIVSSKIANSIRKFFLNDGCDDTGCSLKVFNKQIFLKLPEFNGLHRFLPAFYRGFGYKTDFINVDHRHRKFGKSKYGTFLRLIRGIKDLIKVYLIIKSLKKS